MTQNRSKATLVTAPASEPVTATEAKKQLELGSGSDHDDQLTLLIEAARQQWEHDTDSALMAQTWRVYFDSFGCGLQLPKAPVQSITSVKYYDLDNSQQTLSTSVYSTDLASGRIVLAYDQSWPSYVSRWDAIEVDYAIGVADAADVPAIAKQAILLLIGHYFENRDMVMSEAMQSLRPYEALVRRYMRSSYP